MRRRLATILTVLVLPAAALAQTSDTPAPGDWPRYARDLSGALFAADADRHQATSSSSSPPGVPPAPRRRRERCRRHGADRDRRRDVPADRQRGGRARGRQRQGDLAPSGQRASVRRAVTYWPGDGAIGPAHLLFDRREHHRARSEDRRTRHQLRRRRRVEDRRHALPLSADGLQQRPGHRREHRRDAARRSGDSRAYDARTGQKLWEFHTVPQPGEVGHETWLDDGWKGRSGTNMWVWYTTVDRATGTSTCRSAALRPTTTAATGRGANLFGNSIVAVDAETGKYKWHFQTDPPRPVGLGSAGAAGAVRHQRRTARRSPRSPRPASLASCTSSTATPASRCSGSRSARSPRATCPAKWYIADPADPGQARRSSIA